MQVYAAAPMPDNLPHPGRPASEAPFALPGHRVLALSGRDAVAFAQAQFCNDVAALADGHWQWNGWLTPKGRVLALFALLRMDAETLWLLSPDADPALLAEQLRRFVFRSKLQLVPRADLHASGRPAPPLQARGSAYAPQDDGSLELDLSGEGGARTLVLGPAAAGHDDAALLRWTQADLAHGLPRLEASQAGQWTPQQLSLERLLAYSVRKGCYPGQEIVARTHFLGQAKRGLMRLQGAGVGVADAVVHAAFGDAGGEAQAVGQVVCAAGDQALAIMALDAGDGPFHASGHACERLPLLGGLAR